MGRDNQPKHRQRGKIERKGRRRNTFDRILIVCEGKKTEPNYFEGLRTFLRLSSANITAIPSGDGPQPMKVVDFARDYCRDTNNRWEKVFCVFDEDDHPDFEKAIRSAAERDGKLKNDQGEKIRFYAIPSSPCFELWLALHFEAVSSRFSCHEMLDKVKRLIPGYEKGAKGIYERTREFLNKACQNADKISRNRDGAKITNPYTAVGEVMKELMSLVKQASYNKSAR
jgi:hypothetical protein